MSKNEEKTGFITKASAKYCDQFFIRAGIQLIPNIGGALDTLLSGLGAKYQYERLEGFISDLQDKFRAIFGIFLKQQVGLGSYDRMGQKTAFNDFQVLINTVMDCKPGFHGIRCVWDIP